MPWSNALPDASTLFVLNLIVSCLSILGSSIMFYFCFRTSPKSVSIKFLLSIAFYDILYSISNLMSAFESTYDGILCHVESILREYSLVSSIFMVVCLSITCYKISKMRKEADLEYFLKVSVYICILFSLTMAFAPYYIPQLSYQNQIMDCMILANPYSLDPDTQLVAILFQSRPIVLGIIFTFIIYILTIRRVNKLPEMIVQKLGSSIYKLLWYPAVLFITYISGLLNVFLQILDLNPPVWMNGLHLVTTHSIGFANAVVYSVQARLFRGKEKEEETEVDDNPLERSNEMSGLSLQLQIAQAIALKA